MRKYYVHYYRDFGNTYNLFHASTPDEEALLPKNSIRISRKEAERYCREERRRRKEDPAFSGYADTMIFPADYNEDKESYLCQDHKFKVDGFVVIRREYKNN